MIIPINSNVISGLYFVIFETLIPLTLGLALQAYIRTSNLHALHNRKQALHLTTSRLSVLADYGVTAPRNARLTSLIGSCVLILTIIGSFSIDGRSPIATKTVNAELFISPSSNPDDVIDFTRHISFNGSQVSASYVLARDAVECFRFNGSSYAIYSAVGSVDGDLDSLVHDTRDFPRNISCSSEINGFIDGVVKNEDSIEDAEVESDCGIFVDPTVRNTPVWPENVTFGCDIETIETWCSKFINYFCVIQVRIEQKYSLIYVALESIVPNPPVHQGSSTLDPFPTRAVQSIAYMFATGVDYRTGSLEAMSRMSIKRNRRLEVIDSSVPDGRILETEVSVALFLGTAGLSTVITVLVSLAALLKWRRNIFGRGLGEKNGLSDAIDVMVLAASIGHDAAEIASDTEVIVGINKVEARVGPMAEAKVGGSEFREEEILGRLKNRKNGGSLIVSTVLEMCFRI